MLATRDDDTQEWMDAEDSDPAELAGALVDLRRINAVLRWTPFTVATVARVVREHGLCAFSLLDVASGSADMPQAIAHWARHARIPARIVATDVNATVVDAARAQVARDSEITVERQNALALDYPTGSFDIAMCTLALHHFAPVAAVQLLRELARVGRTALVFDLVRSPFAYVGAWALTRGLGMHRMTRHDALASVRRGYTPEEVLALARLAGLRHVRVRTRFPARMVLQAEGAGTGAQEREVR